MRTRFTLQYWEDDGWFVGRLKEVPGVFSQGETLGDLVANVRDAYQMLIAEDAPEYAAGPVPREMPMEIEV
jgi:predicted RNase H-like HicB family nuclease